MKKGLLTLALLITSSSLWSQDMDAPMAEEITPIDSTDTSVRHFRIGTKIGFPNVVGGSIEVVLPILENRIAPYVDISGFTLNAEDDVTSALSYREIGANFYLGKHAKGMYLSAGTANLSTKFTFNDLSLDNGVRGTGTVTEEINTFNLKLGIKSKGRIYFRFELGYGLGDIPNELSVVGSGTAPSGQTVSETITEPIPSLPGVNDNGVIIGNFGIGISF